MGVPIIYGSKNRVDLTVRGLNPKVRINYYDLLEDYLKLDKIYDKRKSQG